MDEKDFKECYILDLLDLGIAVVDENLKIYFWNSWLETHTKISKEEAEGKRLDELFPDIDKESLIRKIKTAFALKSTTFILASVKGYLLKIPLKKVTNPIYKFMQQDVSIFPLSPEKGLALIVIHDQTPMQETQYKLRKKIDEINSLKAELERYVKKIEQLSITDSLTKIYNRSKFESSLDYEIERARRYGNPLSLIIFDIDHFKSINDTYGHLIGDSVLTEIANLVKNNIRSTDIFARWGGEEFVILAPNINKEQAKMLAEKIRKLIAHHRFKYVDHVTVSLGVTEFLPSDNKESFIKRADEALYLAKRKGRNRVEVK